MRRASALPLARGPLLALSGALLLLLPLLLALLATPSQATSVLTAQQAQENHAMLVAIPLPGHLNPLLSQGLELRRRGWHVTIASPSRMQRHIERSIEQAHQSASNAREPRTQPPKLQYMNLGECAAVAQLHDALERAADQENYMESAREMFEWSLSLHHCMYVSLHAQLTQLTRKPDIIVSDFATYAGFDVADALGIPFIVNNADLLNMLGPDDLPPYDFVPGTMTATSISAFNTSASLWGLLPRAIYPPARTLLRWIAEMTAGKALGEQQQLAGLQPSGLFARFRHRLILVNNVFGLEYARPLPPNVVMVGPMLDHPWTVDRSRAREEYRQQLSEEDLAWLNYREEGKPALPVMWVSMGTIAPLNQRQVLEMYTAFESATRNGLVRILWKLDPSDFPFLPDDLPSTQQLRIVTWVSSQLGVLSHDATRIFLSHCGINSVHESVYLGTQLLCIPILADQADMAARVEDAGVGTHLSKSTFNATTLTHAITDLLAPGTLARTRAHLVRARAAMLLSGGVNRAVDYIEFVAQHGTGALVPIDVSYPWIVRSSLDVALLHGLLALLMLLFWRWVCCTVRPGKECIADRKKIKDVERRRKDQ